MGGGPGGRWSDTWVDADSRGGHCSVPAIMVAGRLPVPAPSSPFPFPLPLFWSLVFSLFLSLLFATFPGRGLVFLSFFFPFN